MLFVLVAYNCDFALWVVAKLSWFWVPGYLHSCDRFLAEEGEREV